MGSVPEVPFPDTPGSLPGVEVLGLPRLVTRIGGRTDGGYGPVRPAFHLVISVRAGLLPCSVDSTECVAPGGSWLWVRPGQELRFRSGALDAEGAAVLFQANVLGPDAVAAVGLDQRAWRLPVTLPPPADAPVRQTLAMLETEQRRLGSLPVDVHAGIMRHLLAVLLMRLTHLPDDPRARAAGSEAFHRFHQAVENGFTRSHRVADYARCLGYSVRTLSRATRAAVGHGAKRLIDDRVLLEAKRMLLHTALPASRIAERLGFPHATAFTRFFRERTGRTPTAFRLHANRTQD
ncbi:AraC family transcriptional regulator [Streptomyces kasugaensis]|uniref:AraC family transcriptional regulator n=1 Tax=Streptomyces kasugaensis TaxID=1946 RepID=A0A4Q9I1C4_STRKA|nr:AraC family transcriptional regulator [Streptomyces kasugaensis]TBO61488.1 AraC family transcriptional regulator [Streptomyces kasugaensis]